MLRYALIQLPGLAAAVGILMLVRHWIAFPDCYGWIAIGLWIAKDVALFPYLWHAYDWDNPKHVHPMIGRRGQARRKLEPEGLVQIGGELWNAETQDPSQSVGEGEWVRVVDMDGLLLVVKPDRPGNGGSSQEP